MCEHASAVAGLIGAVTRAVAFTSSPSSGSDPSSAGAFPLELFALMVSRAHRGTTAPSRTVSDGHTSSQE